MLPTIDTINPGVGGGVPPRRPEAEKAVEAYKTPSVRENPEEGRISRIADSREQVQALKSKNESTDRGMDRVEINLQLSREERDAFQAALASKQDPDSMSSDERETLKKASERITKFIEDTVARNADNRERVEKAVSEWYSRLSKGERDGPIDLINLLRQAAMGNLDDLDN